MTVDLDLTRLLESSTVRATAPAVANLQRLARRRHRVRAGITAAATGLAAATIVVAGLALVDLDPATTEIETVTPTSVPTPTPTPAPMTPASDPEAGPDLVPPILALPDDWDFESFGSTGWTAPRELVAVTTEAGGLGPVAWIGYNDGVATLDYQDGPLVHHDTTSPQGHTVRLGYDHDPNALTAIFLLGEGSVAIGSHDIAEADLLQLVDAITVADGRPVVDPAILPAALQLVPAGPPTRHLATSYSLRKGTTTVMVSVQRRLVADTEWLLDVRHRPNITLVTFNGRRTLLLAGDDEAGEWPTAIIEAEAWVYTINLAPWDATTPTATVEELEAIVRSLTPISEIDLRERVPWLQDRQPMLDRWLADVTLPSNVDLEWLRAGPPMGPGEAEFYYQVLTCIPILDWAETGSPASLDQVAASGDWTVTQDLTQFYAGIDHPEVASGLLITEAEIEEARSATTLDERQASILFQDCVSIGHLTGQWGTGER